MATPYRHLLCPVDFSDISRMALIWSIQLANELEAKLSVVHAVDTVLLNVGNLVAVPDGGAELRRQAEAQMAAWKEDLDLNTAEVSVVEGVPAAVIVNATESGETDLLVMGTHGLSGIQKLLLGSVMEKVLHRVRVPLLSFSPRSPDGWPPKNVLLAVDFGPETASVVRHGVWFAEHFRATLHLAHAVPIPYVVLNERSMERLTPAQIELLTDTLTTARREELQGLVPDSLGVPAEFVATVGPSHQVLMDIVGERNVDLVIMGAGGHGESGLGWLGSTCHKMVRSAPCRVLIVR